VREVLTVDVTCDHGCHADSGLAKVRGERLGEPAHRLTRRAVTHRTRPGGVPGGRAGEERGRSDGCLAMTTEDGTRKCPRGTFRADEDGTACVAADVEGSTNYAIDMGPDAIVSGSEPPLRVLYFCMVGDEDRNVDAMVALTELTMMEVDGQLKVAEMGWTPQ